VNRYLAALKEDYNGIGLAVCTAASIATMNPIPLLAGLVAEAAYLLIVPDMKWYRDRLERRNDAAAEAERRKFRERMLPTLRPETQARFAHLEEMRQQIGTQEDSAWYREIVRKLDYLLEKFLLFGAKEAQFQSYLMRLRAELGTGEWDLNTRRAEPRPRGSERRPGRRQDEVPQRPLRLVDADKAYGPTGEQDEAWVAHTVEEIQRHYAEECERLEALLQTDQDEANRAVLTKRVDVLQRRSEFAGKIGKILGNINHQLQLVDDTFGLINDEIRARSPEQILADIDEVCTATDSMSSTLEEIAPYEQMVARTGS
jgi:hypothetical protein